MDTQNTAAPAAQAEGAKTEGGQPTRGQGYGRGRTPGGNRPGGPRRGNRPEADKEFDQRILALDRVTRVTKGGKRMRFRACVIIGDRKGRVAYGVAKAGDVTIAVNKAVTQAKKRLVTVPLVKETIPHQVAVKFRSARLIMKPAPAGTGIKAGGALRVVMELAGVPNVVGKLLGSGNKINNVKATFDAIKLLRVRTPKPAAA